MEYVRHSASVPVQKCLDSGASRGNGPQTLSTTAPDLTKTIERHNSYRKSSTNPRHSFSRRHTWPISYDSNTPESWIDALQYSEIHQEYAPPMSPAAVSQSIPRQTSVPKLSSPPRPKMSTLGFYPNYLSEFPFDDSASRPSA